MGFDKLSNNPGGKCIECNRQMPSLRRTGRCTNCTPSKYKGHHECLVSTLYHRCILDIGTCQLCNTNSCEFLWSCWSNAQYVVRMSSRDPLENVADFWSDVLDLTAICLPCRTKCHGDKFLWRHGTVQQRIFDCANGAYWRHIAQGMTEYFNKLPPNDDAGTKAPPGSKAKVEVLARRVASGRHLWHPDDETIPVSPDERYATRTRYEPSWRHQPVLDLFRVSIDGKTDDGSTWLNSVSSR